MEAVSGSAITGTHTSKKRLLPPCSCGVVEKFGGREGIRTPGLLVANEALSQLSYSPTSSKSILAKAQMLANTRSTACKHLGAQHLSRLGRDAAPLTPKTHSAGNPPYGCSTGPPARWATIFLAFWYSARA